MRIDSRHGARERERHAPLTWPASRRPATLKEVEVSQDTAASCALDEVLQAPCGTYRRSHGYTLAVQSP